MMYVQRPGLLSSFQDSGRWGYQHLGVSVTGAMDTLAHRLANLIVGNQENDCATLEMTLMGPTLRFDSACCLCLTGADMQAHCDDKPVTPYRPFIARKGQTLRLKTAAKGTRTYLSVFGGFTIPSLLGSQSTYLRADLGGFQGRALRAKDQIKIHQPLPDNASRLDALETALRQINVYLPASIAQFVSHRSDLRFLHGEHWNDFTPEARQALVKSRWRISADSERMGYRLEGPELHTKQATQILSGPTSFGTIQVPGSGQPIVLMADRQTTGGYPKIATIATVDLPALAQKRPGEYIELTPIRHSRAQALDLRREQAFAQLTVTSRHIQQLIEKHI
ncbi:biotin-dependent carboxyltransferase family protein [Orrella sp. 11846]|uniref:5-oxoprolinase subunit C family protein n=1 Tax=Orrella sp. 11846 TaxID=3409913 RepID=UPI003B5C97E5